MVDDENLDILQDQINYLSDRIKNDKIKNVQNEELKIKWIKVLAYICKIHASMRKDQEILEIREEIKNLKIHLQLDDWKKINYVIRINFLKKYFLGNNYKKYYYWMWKVE